MEWAVCTASCDSEDEVDQEASAEVAAESSTDHSQAFIDLTFVNKAASAKNGLASGDSVQAEAGKVSPHKDVQDPTLFGKKDGHEVPVPHGMCPTWTVNASEKDGVSYSESKVHKIATMSDEEEEELFAQEVLEEPAEEHHNYAAGKGKARPDCESGNPLRCLKKKSDVNLLRSNSPLSLPTNSSPAVIWMLLTLSAGKGTTTVLLTFKYPTETNSSICQFGISRKHNPDRFAVQRKRTHFTEDGKDQEFKLAKISEQHRKNQMPCESTECQSSENIQADDLEDNYAAEEPFTCLECNQPFKTANSLSEHRRQSHFIENACRCLECSTTFNSLSLLNQHWQKDHLLLELIKCPECTREFVNQKYLLHHLNASHNADKPFKCTECLFACKSSFLLIRHQSLAHTKGSLKCLECNKYFANPADLFNHQIASYNAEKPVQCTNCNITFVSSSLLNEHLLTHCKSYKCAKCSLTFSSSLLLGSHLVTVHALEDRYKCSHCSEGFSELNLLKRHQLLNHGVKEYFPCARCNLHFYKLEQLRKHQALCSGGPSYQCADCDQNFKYKWQLTTHMLHVHKV